MESATLPLVERSNWRKDDLVLRLHQMVVEYVWLWLLPNIIGITAFFITAVCVRVFIPESLVEKQEIGALSIVALVSLISLALVYTQVKSYYSWRVREIESEMDRILATEEGQEAEHKLSLCFHETFSGRSFPYPLLM